jgi:glycine betaine/choline ABC-type transport system substrate-binding protein
MKALCALLFVLAAGAASAETIVIGSKKFTESYVLAEIAKRSFENAGITAEHRQGMGGTIILWEALRTGPGLRISGIHRHDRGRDLEDAWCDIARDDA